MKWTGVIPAITTNLAADGSVDIPAIAKHARWMIESGCTGIVCSGSLGEAATLTFDEKLAVARACIEGVAGKTPVVLGIASLSTSEAVALAREAAKAGCAGLMVLPPYVYSTDWREMCAHVSAVIEATTLPCMLYNNPPAYRTDFLPEQIAELAEKHANLRAVKESSGDVRRITAIRALLGDRLTILVGLDDAIVEGVAAGATGWIAGLANAFPRESVALFDAAVRGDAAKRDALYRWFLPLLRLDTVPEFVQLIKLVQEKVGLGSERVRAPRLALHGAEREAALRVIDHAIAHAPVL